MAILLTGSGHYVPERVVTNDELAPQLGSTAEWIEERTGIVERRYAAPGQSASDLGLEAAKIALDEAGIGAGELDAIVFATLSPDAMFPGAGVFLQRKLGLEATPALDVRNQCSGFLYGLSVARAWLLSGTYRRVLLVGAEVHSAGLDFTPAGRGVTLLFGDGAGAVVLERDDSAAEDAGVLEVNLGADGRGAEQLWCELPGSASHPSITAQDIAEGRHFPKMMGRVVFRRAVEVLEREVGALLARYPDEDALFVPHQANRHITEMVAKRLGLPDERCVHTIERFGNTTAASLPTALDIARRDGRAHPGRLVAMAAFGSGFTWGSAAIRMS